MNRKHYNEIIAWAEGKQIQVYRRDDGWINENFPSWHFSEEYRIKQYAPPVDNLRLSVFTVLEGWTLPHDVRKILEAAYYEDTPTLSNQGSETNITRGLEPKGFGMVTLNQVGMRVDLKDTPPRNPWQEPVGWFLKDHLETYMESYKDIEGAIPLYTAPPRKEWVGLTAEEIFEITERLTKEGGVNCDGWIVAVEVQQKLKEKNV